MSIVGSLETHPVTKAERPCPKVGKAVLGKALPNADTTSCAPASRRPGPSNRRSNFPRSEGGVAATKNSLAILLAVGGDSGVGIASQLGLHN